MKYARYSLVEKKYLGETDEINTRTWAIIVLGILTLHIKRAWWVIFLC